MPDTLPRKLTPQLLAFCNSISQGEKPLFISSKPSKDAQPSCCFNNVEVKVARAGGSIAYGWAIWHTPGVMFEAEHHGVWRKRNGDLLDVSPQFNGYDKILFLPDPGAVYDPSHFRSNVYAAETDDPLVVEFVALARRTREIQDKYRGVISPDRLEFDCIDVRVRELMRLLKIAF